MKSKTTIVFFTIVLSITLLFVVNLFLQPFSMLSEVAAYEPVILRFNFMNYPDLHAFAITISPILMVAMIVMIRRAYTRHLDKLLHVALPILVALFFHFLIVNKIDTYFNSHNYFGFFKLFFLNLPAFFTNYIKVGLILFLVIMLTCYPAAILIDKLLLYLTKRFKGV